MPRHLISDAHEWINEIPTVPIYYLANPQPRERAWNNQRGKKTLLSLTLVRRCEMTYEVTQPSAMAPGSGFKPACSVSYAGDNVRWGVWLGRHIC
ncbi:hypothetical protein THAOC_21443 [Thalassiosira oceanica]|uniref:Uncharacterized protein n=1 Tax=Thalassiosira oceanica TaxID=159749 RepID=K0SBX2_THAOC|nr:hypothetical protein THAOC_21443 [Thalassiosira oceanica]|eukprot:EJK58441.1 hypothetical protein THAOC_21443 [Thalassiosira oceanica]